MALLTHFCRYFDKVFPRFALAQPVARQTRPPENSVRPPAKIVPAN